MLLLLLLLVLLLKSEVALYSSFIANSQYIDFNFHFKFSFYLSLILEHAKEGRNSEDSGEKGEGLLSLDNTKQ